MIHALRLWAHETATRFWRKLFPPTHFLEVEDMLHVLGEKPAYLHDVALRILSNRGLVLKQVQEWQFLAIAREGQIYGLWDIMETLDDNNQQATLIIPLKEDPHGRPG